ncbi:site-specific integrase [uncultured Cloacibacillus sp.]|uniref:site-specific integrase n=1 Tax=uncultured Cloacibacillus sp. TaxID=889794 RepID=UPI00260CA154|nr:site-specific integrase [uncultured Cloacibacillus sp.]
MKVKLTQTMIASIPIPEKRTDYRDSAVQGLTLRVEPSGRKSWYLDYKFDGRRRWWFIGRAAYISLSDARREAQAFLGILAKGKDPLAVPEPEMTCGLLREKYYAPWVIENRKSGGETVKGLKRYFSRFDERSAASLTVGDMELWRREMRETRKLKAATLNRAATYLTAMLNWAVKRKLISANPLEELDHLKETDSKKSWRFLSKEEIAVLKEALRARDAAVRAGAVPCIYAEPMGGAFADPLEPMALVSLNTGVRWGTLVSLRWRNVDLAHGTLYIDADSTKAEAAQTLPLNSSAMDVLKKWHEEAPDAAPAALVFPAPMGGMFYNVNKAWYRLLADSGLGHLRWHDLRHTFASQLVIAGIPLNTVRELLGHKNIKTTLRYAHLAPQGLRAAVECI